MVPDLDIMCLEMAFIVPCGVPCKSYARAPYVTLLTVCLDRYSTVDPAATLASWRIPRRSYKMYVERTPAVPCSDGP